MKQQTWLFIGIWWCIAAVTALWSYHFVDPNLTLVAFPAFVEWQTTLWAQAKDTASMTWQYILILGLWWTAYGWTIHAFHDDKKRSLPRWGVTLLVGVITLLFLGHNALSHDIFNYLFNAKMVTVYGANPHVQVALDFASDPWVRFMHNTHTAAPYGWGWTALSLIPFMLSAGKFIIAYFSMKLWMILGLGIYLWVIWWLLQRQFPRTAWRRWSLLAFHPLLLIETALNGHNDVWMMWPVMVAMGWLCCGPQKKKWYFIVGALALLVLSVQIKLATIVLLPMLLWWVVPKKRTLSLWAEKKSALVKKVWRWAQLYRADIASFLLFIPLLTARSQQFHPWYLIWSLTFLPFGKSQAWRSILMGLSVTSTLRYMPLIFAGWEYSPLVQAQMRWVTWSGAILGIISWLIWKNIMDYRKR